MTTPVIQQVYIYRCDGLWCYAAWTAENGIRDYDHSDVVDDAAADAAAEVVESILQAQFPRAAVAFVPAMRGAGMVADTKP